MYSPFEVSVIIYFLIVIWKPGCYITMTQHLRYIIVYPFFPSASDQEYQILSTLAHTDNVVTDARLTMNWIIVHLPKQGL